MLQSRAMLMQKLDRTGVSLNIANSFGAPALSASGLPLPPGFSLWDNAHCSFLWAATCSCCSYCGSNWHPE
ncbi:unnamed protein product [Rhodiola kirilowii]